MTNCKCDSTLRKGESECDECLVKRTCNLGDLSEFLGYGNVRCIFVERIAKALRIAEKAGKSTEEEKNNGEAVVGK